MMATSRKRNDGCQQEWEWGSSSSEITAPVVTRLKNRPRLIKPPQNNPPSLDLLSRDPASVKHLWLLYRFYPFQAYRDRLVEYYLSWIQGVAESIVRRMHLPDTDNAIGEALLFFSMTIVPRFNGRGNFKQFAVMCMKRRLVDLYRRQGCAKEVTRQPDDDESRNWVEECPDVREHPLRGCCFEKITRWLPDRQAKILKMRYRDYLGPRDVAGLLGVSTGTIKHEMREAIRAIRIHWGNRVDELLR